MELSFVEVEIKVGKGLRRTECLAHPAQGNESAQVTILPPEQIKRGGRNRDQNEGGQRRSGIQTLTGGGPDPDRQGLESGRAKNQGGGELFHRGQKHEPGTGEDAPTDQGQRYPAEGFSARPPQGSARLLQVGRNREQGGLCGAKRLGKEHHQVAEKKEPHRLVERQQKANSEEEHGQSNSQMGQGANRPNSPFQDRPDPAPVATDEERQWYHHYRHQQCGPERQPDRSDQLGNHRDRLTASPEAPNEPGQQDYQRNSNRGEDQNGEKALGQCLLTSAQARSTAPGAPIALFARSAHLVWSD